MTVTSSLIEEMNSAIVVKWGALSAESAIITTFSRQSLAISRLETTPRE